MAISEAALRAFGWPAELRHAPGPADAEGNRFRSACRCGWAGKLSPASPSHAYQVTKLHAESENAREAAGGEVIDSENYSHDGGLPRGTRKRVAAAVQETADGIRVVVSAPRKTTTGTPCGCGCGELSGGLFRPGHDSKLLSRLVAAVKSGSTTLDGAVAEMSTIGCSDKLINKFKGKAAA